MKTFEVTTNDPVYKGQKTFKGFLLKDVFALLGPLPESADEISFVAKDGYAPSVSVTDGLTAESYVTFADNVKKTGFEIINQGGKNLDLGPYYLVWKDESKIPDYYPRPYQLVRIEIIDFKTLYRGLYPEVLKQKENEKKGFLVFKNHCVKCHSINGAGGSVGPELNFPKNVTEYWNVAELRNYIRNPAEFRLRATMPSFEKLDATNMDNLISYLTLMKGYKEKPNP